MRWVKRILAFLLIVLLAATAFGIYTVRRSFPQVSGEIEAAGLESSVEVIRDELGVPHIYASSTHDLFFAQGVTHAQDRFWQMDFWRHIGAGRLSEMFGESQVETDMFLRSLGFTALAEQEWEQMGSPAREVLQAYADGVNAFITDRAPSDISLEYAIMPLQNSGYEIEPWTPVNTLTWAKVMSWDLSGNMGDEIARARLGQVLPLERVEQLYPEFPADKPAIVERSATSEAGSATASLPAEAIDALIRAETAADDLWAMTGGGFEGIGSNNWVVSGDLTETGMPLLANDTHLAIQMPSIWYENGLHCTEDSDDCPFQVVGFTFAGTPGVVIGHNEHHAWGVTTQAVDTQDLYVERVNPANPDQYEVEGEWVDFTTRSEVIAVAGGDDVEYDVRSTRHGPVISETYLPDDQFDGSETVDTPADYVVALTWQTLQPSTLVEAIIGMNTAQSYDEFREAVSKWDIAAQNIVYADIEGNIAYHSTGEIPIRSQGDGRYPVPGWDSSHEWIGLIPFDDLPTLFNPPEGFIETANQPVLRPGSEPLIGIDGAYGYRGGRIAEMLQTSDSHTVSSMQAIQMDVWDGGATHLVPHLLDLDTSNPDIAWMQTELEGWSTGSSAYLAEGRSRGAAIYQAVWRHVLARTFQDDLPEDYWPSGGSRWFEVVRHLLETPDDPYWDDVNTGSVESRDDILAAAMGDAYAELTELVGDDTANWTWGALHAAEFENQTFGQSGIGPIEWLFNRGAPPRVGGSSSVVNAVGWDTDVSYVVDWLPSERMVVDLADFDASTFVHTTGQSGHAFADNYDTMIEMWVDGDHGPMPWTREAVESYEEHRLVLVPTD